MNDRPIRILVVEDNLDTLRLLEYLLKPGFEVDAFAHVQDALTAVETNHYDLFLLDINLGGQETGINLLKRLKAARSRESIPAVALTAYAMPGDRERFLSAGFNEYVGKPFTRQELVDTIRLTLGGNHHPHTGPTQ
jgi:two-component system, cell cycle response regulator DivK